MAVRFDNHADRLLYSGTPASITAYTVACWLRVVTDRNNYSNIFAIEDNASGFEWHELMTANDGTTLNIEHHSGSITLGAMSVGTWYFAAFTVGASYACNTYFASSSASSLSTNSGTLGTFTAPHHCMIGSTQFSEFFNGRIANVRLWDAELSAAEIANERWRSRPGRLSNLRAWWPLTGYATKLVDYSGNARALTAPGAGAWQTEDGPNFSGRRRRVVTTSAAASGATGTVAVTLANATSSASGAETFTGTTAQTLADATLAGSGTGAATGTAAHSLANATAAASGAETFAGSTAVTLANATSSASGAETFTGTTAATLGDATSAASGSETYTGTSAVTLGNATLAGFGVMGTGGSASCTLADASCAGSGAQIFTGATSTTLANATAAGAGAQTFTGAVSQSLGNATAAGAGAESFAGTVSRTLADATSSADGVVTPTGASGTVAVTLGNATATGSGAETFTGSVGVTLGNATNAAAGTESFTGSGSQTLADSTSSAAGAETFTGSSSGTLADSSCSASGTVAASGTTGSLAVTLGNATAVISGAVAGVEPTDAWAHYRFNEIGNQVAISDASGNSRTLFPSYDASGFPKRVAGKLGKARDFSRANATTHPVATAVILSPFVLDRTAAPSQAEVTAFADNEWSTAFWFRRRTDETPGGAGVVWSLGSSGRVSTDGVFQIMRTTVRFSTLSGGIFQALTDRLVGATVFGLGGSFTTYNPPVGRWIHVGIVCRHVSGSLVVDLYIDGTLVETKTSIITGLPNFTTYPPAAPTFTVGARCQALTAAQDPTEPIVFTGPLSGAVDDLRLYARELAADEVAAIAAAYAPYTGRVYFELLNPGASSAVLSSPGEATTELIAPSYSRAELLTEGTRITLEDS